MFLESFDSYIEALRSWDGTSPRPKSIFERALLQSRGLFVDGDRNYLLLPGSMMLLNVMKKREKLSVVKMKSISLEPLNAFLEENSDEATMAWLNLCFFEAVDGILYDSFYDSLPIRNGSDESIKQFMAQLQDLSMPIMELPEGSILAFPNDAFFPKPMCFLLQQRGIRAIHFDSTVSIPDDSSIEPAILNVELMTSCGALVPNIGKKYRMTSYDLQDLPSYAPKPEEMYQITIDGTSHQVFYYTVRFESDCFGNITAFSSSSHGPEKVTSMF